MIKIIMRGSFLFRRNVFLNKYTSFNWRAIQLHLRFITDFCRLTWCLFF